MLSGPGRAKAAPPRGALRGVASAAPADTQGSHARQASRQVIQRYRVNCHHVEDPAGGVAFDAMASYGVADDPTIREATGANCAGHAANAARQSPQEASCRGPCSLA